MSLDKSIVAKRYAKALVELTHEHDQLEQTYQELNAIRKVFTDNPTLQEALSGTKLNLDQKMDIIKELKEGVSEYVQNFIQMVYDYGRINEMVAIIDEFEAQYDNLKQIVHADVVSAVQLDEERRKRLADAIVRRLNVKKVVLNEQVNPQIIGGLIIKVGSQTLDASLRTKIQKLRHLLVK